MRILMIVLLLSGCYSAEAIYEDGEKVEGCRGNDSSSCWVPGNRACINGRCVAVDEDWTGPVNWYCGDGSNNEDEECDGGSDNADDAACTLSCVKATCGDGLLRADLEDDDSDYEACDDGNDEDGDGCSADCEIE